MHGDDRTKIRRPPRDRRMEAIFQAWLSQQDRYADAVTEPLVRFAERCEAGEVEGLGPEEYAAEAEG